MIITDDNISNPKLNSIPSEMREHIVSFCQNRIKARSPLSNNDFDLIVDFIHYVAKAVVKNNV